MPEPLKIIQNPLKMLEDCAWCPRDCHVNRLKDKNGFCRSDAGFNIASICIHRGEEPVISGSEGICNVFFTNCNLQCVYCQNHQISDNRISRSFSKLDAENVTDQIKAILDQGVKRVGFVSPSHFIPQMIMIIQDLENQGYFPVWVYNSNGYDKVGTLEMLEGIVDVYLPDLKYSDALLAKSLSGAADYPEHAYKALKEMFRQKGSTLILDEEGCAESGMIVRHLVLPGFVENSRGVIRFLAEELSPRLHLSLMSQYYPVCRIGNFPEMNRNITKEEYQQVVDETEKMGMFRGWIQEFESNAFYRPDFRQDHPFER